jgi:hypothetical protein
MVKPWKAIPLLFGGELPKLDSSSQDENLKSGLDVQVDSAQSMIAVTSEGIIQSTAISEDDGIAFQGFTMDDIGLAQWEDPDLRLILNFLKYPMEPEESKLFLSSPGAKSYWINKQMFVLDKHGVLRNGVICQRSFLFGFLCLLQTSRVNTKVRISLDIL